MLRAFWCNTGVKPTICRRMVFQPQTVAGAVLAKVRLTFWYEGRRRALRPCGNSESSQPRRSIKSPLLCAAPQSPATEASGPTTCDSVFGVLDGQEAYLLLRIRLRRTTGMHRRLAQTGRSSCRTTVEGSRDGPPISGSCLHWVTPLICSQVRVRISTFYSNLHRTGALIGTHHQFVLEANDVGSGRHSPYELGRNRSTSLLATPHPTCPPRRRTSDRSLQRT